MILSRRSFLRGMGAALTTALATSACSSISDRTSPLESMINLFSSSSLKFAPTKTFEENPWIEDEIREFLLQREVLEVLGHDPQNYNHKILITVNESAVIRDYGESWFNIIYLNGIVYGSKHYSREEVEKVVRNSFSEDYSLDNTARFESKVATTTDYYFALNDSLSKDQELLKLNRNLLVAHELSHVFGNTEQNYSETEHGVSTRVEIKIATKLYQSGKISRELWSKLFNYKVKYLNNDNESEERISAYQRKILGQ